MLFVDASTNRVGIGKSDPARTLDVHGSVEFSVNTASHETFIFSTQAANDAKLMMQNASSVTAVQLSANGDTFFNGGNVAIGATSPISLDGNATPGLTITSNGPFIVLQDANNADKVNYIANNTGVLQFGLVGDNGATGKTEVMNLSSAGAVFNDSHAAALDFRVESDTNSHMLFLDAGNGRVNINGDGPGVASLNVRGSLAISNSGGAQHILMGNQDSAGVDKPFMLTSANAALYVGVGDSWASSTGGTRTDIAYFDTGQILFNNGNRVQDFRVATDDQTHTLFINGATNKVGLGTGSPDGRLTVNGDTDTGDMIARFQYSGNNNVSKGIRINAPNSSGTQTYVDMAVHPGTNSFGIGLGTSSGSLPIGSDNLNEAEFRIIGSQVVQGNTMDRRIEADVRGFQVTATHGRVSATVQDSFHIGSDRYRNSLLHGNSSTHTYRDGGANNYAGYEYDNESWIPSVFIPYSPNQVYRLSASIFQTQLGGGHASSLHYMGVIGYDENFNFVGVDAIGTYQYNMASSSTMVAGQVMERDVTIKGWQGAGGTDGNKMDQGTVYIKPMMLLNYQRSGCKCVVTGFNIQPAGTVADNDSNAGTNY